MLRLIEKSICKMGFIYCADITVARMCVRVLFGFVCNIPTV